MTAEIDFEIDLLNSSHRAIDYIYNFPFDVELNFIVSGSVQK